MKKLLSLRYIEQEDFELGKTKDKKGSEIMLDNPTQKEIIMAFKELKKVMLE